MKKFFEYNGDNAQEFAEQKYQESIKNYQQMEKRFKELPDTRIVMVGTSPYDEFAEIKEIIRSLRKRMRQSNGLLSTRKSLQPRTDGSLLIGMLRWWH